MIYNLSTGRLLLLLLRFMIESESFHSVLGITKAS